MKKLAMFLVASIMILTGLFQPIAASAADLESTNINNLDINENGFVDQEDVFLIENSLIYGIYSPFSVIDLVAAYRILYDVAVKPATENSNIFCCMLEENDGNHEYIWNVLYSDYPKTIEYSENTITIIVYTTSGKIDYVFNRIFEWSENSEDILIKIYTGSNTVTIFKDFSASIV